MPLDLADACPKNLHIYDTHLIVLSDFFTWECSKTMVELETARLIVRAVFSYGESAF